jgi:hypothetical protein
MSTYQFSDHVIPSYSTGIPTTYSSTLPYSNYATTTVRAPTGYSSTVPFSTFDGQTRTSTAYSSTLPYSNYATTTVRDPTGYSSIVPFSTFDGQTRTSTAYSSTETHGTAFHTYEGTSLTRRQLEQLRGNNSVQPYNTVVVMDRGSTGSRMRLSDSEVTGKVMRCLTLFRIHN